MLKHFTEKYLRRPPPGFGCARLATPHLGGVEAQGRKTIYRKSFTPHWVDFHALRMTYITRLQRAGVSPREAMELARHSDMRLTMKTYTDAAQLPAFGTVGSKPKTDTQTLVDGGQAESGAVLAVAGEKTAKSLEITGGSHGQSCAVTAGPEVSNWRRGGDSNPRYGFWPYNGLANRRLQPLGHLSNAADKVLTL